MTNETWGSVREDLVKRVGRNNYVTWIEPLKFFVFDVAFNVIMPKGPLEAAFGY